MAPTRLQQRQQDLRRAVARLREACEQPDSPFLRDAVIQRFEFCWELAWKALKLRLADLGIEALAPRDTFREALKVGLIDDGNAWTLAQQQRNLTSHTYDEALAAAVYHYVRTTGLPLLEGLVQGMDTWTSD
jgi:nucleotidyltransferase substrate binding protein (TIGR01987 family)